MDILYVDTISSPQGRDNTRGLEKAFARRGNVVSFAYRDIDRRLGIDGMNEQLFQVATEVKPQLIYLGKCGLIFGKTIDRIKSKIDCTVVHFAGDFRWSIQDWIVNLGPHVDITLFQHNDPSVYAKYRKLGCHNIKMWLPGVDTDIMKPMNIENTYDIVFMANNTQVHRDMKIDRIGFIEYLRERGLNIDIFGVGWKAAHPFVTGKNFARVCSGSKMALSYVTREPLLYTSWPRVFKTMACGTLFVTRYFNGIETMFNNNEHLVWFDSFEEAYNKICYYLEHTATREWVAKNGMSLVRGNYSWDRQVDKLFKLL